jgi:hypothetical protein
MPCDPPRDSSALFRLEHLTTLICQQTPTNDRALAPRLATSVQGGRSGVIDISSMRPAPPCERDLLFCRQQTRLMPSTRETRPPSTRAAAESNPLLPAMLAVLVCLVALLTLWVATQPAPTIVLERAIGF